jgi:hypothetical protein
VKVYPSEPVFEKEWQNTRGLPFLDRILKVKRMFRVSYKTVLYRLAETMKPSDNACTQSCIPAWEFDKNTKSPVISMLPGDFASIE